MSRTILELHWGAANQPREKAPAIARALLAKHAPDMLDYLVDQGGWVTEHKLRETVRGGYVSGRFNWQVWSRLLWALEVTGDIIIKSTDKYGYRLLVRLSVNGWLRAVQRGAAAWSGSAVPV